MREDMWSHSGFTGSENKQIGRELGGNQTDIIAVIAAIIQLFTVGDLHHQLLITIITQFLKIYQASCFYV